MNDISGVAAQSAKKCSVTIHNNETKLLVGLEQLGQGLGVELVVTEVQRRVDGLEGLEVDVDLSLLAFRGQDFTAVNNQAIGRDLVVQLESLLGGGNGRENGLSVDTRLDVGGGTLCAFVLVGDTLTRPEATVRRIRLRRHTYSSANILAARET